MKTIGEGAYIILSFKNEKLKKSPKEKKSTVVQPSHQAQVVMLIFYKRALYKFKTIEWKVYELHFAVTIHYTIISNI